MPCSLLIAMQSFPAKDIQQGMILDVRGEGDFGAKEVMPRFGRLTVSNRELDVLKSRVGAWRRIVGFENVSLDSEADKYTLDIVATNAHPTSFLGAITEAEATEEVVDFFGGTIDGTVDKGITATIGMFDVMVSYVQRSRPDQGQLFFDYYDDVAGTHEITLDYSETPWGVTGVLKQLTGLGGVTIVSSDASAKEVVFSVARAPVLAAAKDFLRRSLSVNILKAQHKLSAAAVNLIAASDGEYTATMAQILPHVIDLAVD